MTSTGIRAQVGVKIFGNDLDALQRKAFEVEKVVAEIPGSGGCRTVAFARKALCRNRQRCADLGRYGLSVKQVDEHVENRLGRRGGGHDDQRP
ncbi:MAG: hypothetical protein QM760_02795 [Nibricoccus sp.]